MKMLAFVGITALAIFGQPIGIITLSLIAIFAIPYLAVSR
jgi:hypothetical protein